tara:strand:- start:633 stop:896 length:264 start_codon:yes stop_codon:yes gene_type:complete
MSRKERIIKLIKNKFPDAEIEIKDDSEKHRGHMGFIEGGETHFRLKVVSDVFADLSRPEAHRLVNSILSDEFDDGLHALSLRLTAKK